MKKYKCLASDYTFFKKGQVYQEDYTPYHNHASVKICRELRPERWEEVKEETSKEPLDLTKILKGCEGQTFYCTILGEVTLDRIMEKLKCPIEISPTNKQYYTYVTKEGFFYNDCSGECILFPSKENRDWSTFKTKIPFGTPVMVSNNGTHWKLKKYNEILQNTYIVPVDKFDFSNFEANKY